MKVIIKEPCHEDWNNMQITMHSRHCLKCDKHLVDFSTYSRAEIIAYLLSNPIGSVCGKMSNQQIDFHIDDYPALMEVLKQPRFQPKAFMILALVGASLFTSCEQASNVHGRATISKANNLAISAFKKGKKVKPQPKNKKEIHKQPQTKITKLQESKIPEVIDNPIIDDDSSVEVGYIVLANREIENPEMIRDEPVIFANEEPEFPGGYKAMMEYLKNNLIYPIEEKDNGIQGRVFVRFMVNSTGELKNCFIARGVPDGKGLEMEAIRLIENMPKWKPGKNNGRPISTFIVIPINFTLQ